MLLKKKGVATYLLALLGVSFAMTVLFLIIVGAIYETENIGCQSIKLDLSNVCLRSGGVEFAVANTGETPFKIIFNNDMSTPVDLGIDERKPLKLPLPDDVNKVTVTPFLARQNAVFLCKSKSQHFERNLITINC